MFLLTHHHLSIDRHPDAPRASRQEIQEAVKADPRYRKATKEERDELKKDLLEKREIKAKGARVSHRSAALDVSKTSALVQKQVCFVLLQCLFQSLKICCFSCLTSASAQEFEP